MGPAGIERIKNQIKDRQIQNRKTSPRKALFHFVLAVPSFRSPALLFVARQGHDGDHADDQDDADCEPIPQFWVTRNAVPQLFPA